MTTSLFADDFQSAFNNATHIFLRWLVAGGLAFITACTTSDGTIRPPTIERSGLPAPETDGTWTPVVTLRDTTDRFSGTKDIPRPENGWWVAPIHANLLKDGKVLITGWNRPVEKFCRNHQGRLFGTSFLLDVADLDVKKPMTLRITPLDEQPRKKGDVLYCAGHAPLADGRILFMGGARTRTSGKWVTLETSSRKSSA